jgi:hypothetical protein
MLEIRALVMRYGAMSKNYTTITQLCSVADDALNVLWCRCLRHMSIRRSCAIALMVANDAGLSFCLRSLVLVMGYGDVCLI